jgi:hypothetical protein
MAVLDERRPNPAGEAGKMVRIAMSSAAVLLVIGIAATPSESAAQAPRNLCGGVSAALSENFGRQAAEISGDDNVCTAACRRLLALCRATVRRILTCQNAILRGGLSIQAVLCRREDGGDPKAVRECRANARKQVAEQRNDREDFRNALRACEETVGTCRCGDA